MTPYVILTPGDELVGHILSAKEPTIKEMAHHLAFLRGFEDRDDFLEANRGLLLGFAPLH